MINSKYEIAKKYNISFDVDLKVPIILPFEMADISVLLGNILDNAIEASKDIENPYIKVVIKP